jgi:hypothetical protein
LVDLGVLVSVGVFEGVGVIQGTGVAPKSDLPPCSPLSKLKITISPLPVLSFTNKIVSTQVCGTVTVFPEPGAGGASSLLGLGVAVSVGLGVGVAVAVVPPSGLAQVFTNCPINTCHEELTP